ncbi:MAG: zinc metalloprotease HtpX [archaeon]
MWLQLKMYLVMGAFFAIIYSLFVVAGAYLGIGNFIFYGILATVMMLIQYMIGPTIVNWSMRVRYVTEQQEPELHHMVAELAKKAGIPKPKIGISSMPIPNAFAFGRWSSDARVCITEQIRSLLTKDELKAVLGHEISHIKNRDVLIITLISVVPTIAWYMAWNFMFSRDREGNSNFAIGIAAFAIYFATNLLVLYASRIREYAADQGSIKLGSRPSTMASALFKLVYGSAKTPKDILKQAEGMKAFFANDPSRARRDLAELKQVDADGSGSIDDSELRAIRNKKASITSADRFMEMMSTHPNMVKRVQALSRLN